MRSNSLTAGARALGVLAVALAGSPLVAGPVGDMYTVQGTNFPNTYGATSVTFDGVSELVGGPAPQGLRVNETSTAFAGIAGGLSTNKGAITQFENTGEILEWVFRSQDDGPYNDLPGAWSFRLADIDFGSKAVQYAFTPFIYFLASNGSPLVIPGALVTAFDLQVGVHPLNPAITQVVYLEDDDDQIYEDGKILIESADTTGELNANTIALLTGQQKVPGFAVGGLFAAVDDPPPTLIGDANGDCSVGAADYALWAAQFGQTAEGLSADFDGNGSVGAGDYALWAANFGNTCPPAGAAVPEPSSVGLLLIGLAGMFLVGRRRA